MLGMRQFSLSYLLLETFWLAAVLGITRVFIHQYEASSAATLALLISYGAAIGGAFKRMRVGAIVGLALWLAWIVLPFS